VFVDFHVDALAAKLYALHREAEALLGCSFAPELDFAAGADDALPGKALKGSVAEQAGDGSVIEGIACGGSDFAVGRNLAFGDGADDAAEGVVALLVFAETVFEDASLEILWDGRMAHGRNFSRVGVLRRVTVQLRSNDPTHAMRPMNRAPKYVGLLCMGHPPSLIYCLVVLVSSNSPIKTENPPQAD
jgi:hypothetical protein